MTTERQHNVPKKKQLCIVILRLTCIALLDTVTASCFIINNIAGPAVLQGGVHHSRAASGCFLVPAKNSNNIRRKEKHHHGKNNQQQFSEEPWWQCKKGISSPLLAASKEPWSDDETTIDSHEHHTSTTSSHTPLLSGHDDHNSISDTTKTTISTRRNVLKKVMSTTAASTILLPSNAKLPAFAKDTSSSPTSSTLTIFPTQSSRLGGGSHNPSNTGNIDCLLNLPPVAKDHARFYLCRHGQTENNRLRLVQGARVDPPINNNGRMQAIRLGEAFSALKQTSSASLRDFPTVALHSSLKRARETATVASLVAAGNTGLKEEESVEIVNNLFSNDSMNFVNYNSKGSSNSSNALLTMDTLSTLGEVDFGVMAEGQSVNEAKAEMMATFAQWAVGNVDARNGEDGESARDVFTRISLALNSMLEVASSNNNGGSIMAVSHSTYLRMLLAMVMDVPLLQAASFEQKNCCINVMDVSFKETVDVYNKSNIFGGGLSMAPRDLHLTIPKVQIIRMNEVGHLDGLFS